MIVLLAACAPDLTPAWAWDPIWLEPSEAGVHGFQTWQLYGPKWAEDPDEKFYACAVVVELDGAATACDAEEGCEHAWDVTGALLETDCPDPALADDPLFVSLARLALGGPATGEDVPFPGATSVGWADYGNGWEVHGDAYPAALEHGGTEATAWDGVAPFQLVPAAAFPAP